MPRPDRAGAEGGCVRADGARGSGPRRAPRGCAGRVRSRRSRRGRRRALLGRGDQGRQVRGHAGLEQRLPGAPVAGRVRRRGSRRRRSRSPAGRRSRARRSRGRSPRTAVGGDLRPSTISTSPGTIRPRTRAAATRPRPGPMGAGSAEHASIASFASPPASASASAACSARDSARLRDGRALACAQLLVHRRDADHQVPEGPPEADHRDRRDHVQDELLRRSGLQPGRAGDPPRRRRDGVPRVGARRSELEPSTQVTHPVSAPSRACRLERADDPRGPCRSR